MTATFYLLSSLLLTAQLADRGDWLLTPRWVRAQEFLYRGEYSEEAVGSGTRCLRSCELSTRLLVMDAGDKDFEVAVLTLVNKKGKPAEGEHAPPPLSTRLETVKFDSAGKMTSANTKSLLAPLDGPATVELGPVTEVIRGRATIGKHWTSNEEGRPQRTWEIVATESVNGITCVKLVGNQQSPDWDEPRADHTGWQRVDTVWIAPRQGVVQQVERVILRRDPGHDKPTERLVTKYQLDNTFQYSADRFEYRRLEISKAREFWDAALPLIANPARSGSQMDALVGRIDYHLQRNTETPYREAILRVKRRIEAAKRGEALIDNDQADAAVTVVTVGKPAPDFIAPSMTRQESTELKQWSGKPMVLFFYNPAAESTQDLLPFADKLARKFPQAAVVGMAMSDDRDVVQQQLAELKVGIPVLSGTGLYHIYEVETTPKMVIIDDQGLVRESCLGWGIGVQESIFDGLQKCATPK